MNLYYFKVRNFEDFQHYKKRHPPWIRLYYRLLEDRRFERLQDASKMHAIGLFLLASQHDNKIVFDVPWIEKRLGCTEHINWQVLLDNEFIVPIDCDASDMLASCGQLATKSLSETEVQRQRQKNREKIARNNPSDSSKPAVITLPLCNKTEHPIIQAEIDQWRELYPAVDIMAEIRKAKGWLLANPKKRKTKGGINKFINTWLAKTQDSGGSRRVESHSDWKEAKAKRLEELKQISGGGT